MHLRNDDLAAGNEADGAARSGGAGPAIAAVHAEYRAAASVAGPLRPAGDGDQRVGYRSLMRGPDRLMLTLFVVVNAVVTLSFIGWLLLPEHVPEPGYVGFVEWDVAAARICFCLMIGVEVIKLSQQLALWLLAYHIKDPVPLEARAGLRVALLTTIVPSKEPIELVEPTLVAMTQVVYPGTVDVWILDEEDSPEVRALAGRLGVRHFTRKGRAEYNQPSGPFRSRTKAGNHNAWRAEHESGYDIVAQMDPDHVPFPCMLERTIGYFRDPDTAFVVAPQVYGNLHESFVARGASVQQYVFSGIIERAGNGLDAPLLIGTNHLYRPAAWRQIGGYQDSITEDHLTGMRVLGTVNPATGNPWRGVYTPDVLAIGEGPTSWTDYFNQQKRWAYGIWQIKLSPHLRAGIRLSLRQRVLFGLVQFYYPSVAAHAVFGGISTAGYLLLGVSPARVDGLTWFVLWVTSILTWYSLWLWLRRYNLAPHERRDLGLRAIALTLLTGPIYVVAGLAALFRRPMRYAVTAKGGLSSVDSPRTFAVHSLWATAAAAVLALSLLMEYDHPAIRVWVIVVFLIGVCPPLAATVRARSTAAQRRRERTA